MDFTIKTYRHLLISLKEAGYHFITFEEWCATHETVKTVILRHDVDKKPERSLALARIETSLGIKATYYFRIVPQSNQPVYIKAIAGLGHEIGYHYEDLSLAKGNIAGAYENYKDNLAYFRTFYPVKTISMHGSPASPYDNRDIWKSYDYHEFGIIGEPYFDFINQADLLYFTDTGRCWDGDRFNVRDKAMNDLSDKKIQIHSTQDLTDFLIHRENVKAVMKSTHPQRWTDKKTAWLWEYITQKAKNRVKMYLVKRKGKCV